jgi:hypothetical protein
MKKQKIIYMITASVLSLSSLTACTNDKEQVENVLEETSDTESTESDTASSYLYGTLNLSYADYYYGELNQIEAQEPENSSAGQYDAENKVIAAGFEEEGMYDAVTSATTVKAKLFEAAFTEDTKNGVDILGPSNVNVAISKALYEDVQKAVENKTECNNQLIELVQGMQNVSETEPVEYKVINSDGTISKTIGTTNKVENVTTTLTTTSTWGNYEIMLEGLDGEVSSVQGVILETSDGARYGLQHLDNIWLDLSEVVFSVEEFQDPKTNIAGYKRFEDIQGKTITKITYLIANEDDIEIETSLYCKEQLPDEYSINAPERVPYNSSATVIPITFTVPEGSNYVLSDVIKSRASLGSDLYQIKDDTISLSTDCKPGEYNFIFTDETFSDIKVTCLVESGLVDGDVTFEENKLTLKENANKLTIADYIQGITSISVNDQPLSGGNPGTVVFNEDGSVNLEAVMKGRDSETAVFEADGTYKLSIKANGYVDLEIEVIK